MKSAAFSLRDDYYENFKDIKIFMDFTNKRIKILDYDVISTEALEELISFAKEKGFGKIISNCRIKVLKCFKTVGFKVEGVINGYFRGEDAFCVSYFIDNYRNISRFEFAEDSILRDCITSNMTPANKMKCPFLIRNITESDIPQVIKLFKTVFETYPSPVFDSGYLKSTLKSKILYKGAFNDETLVGIASADMDKDNLNAEITDCATYPEYRGKGVLFSLIEQIENDLFNQDFITLYSLSRAVNPGINKVLCKHRYRYTGRLVNNCNICGGFEDMNIWVKILRNKIPKGRLI